MKKPKPYYPFLIAGFPVLALMANNLLEIQIKVVIRPLIFSILFTALINLVFYFIFRKNLYKAAFISAVVVILFFSYGHLFNLIKAVNFLNKLLGHHRYLLIISLFIIIIGFVIVVYHEIKSQFTKLLNIFSIILLLFPTLNILWFHVTETIAKNKLGKTISQEAYLNEDENSYPDIYYIILDTYARPDALAEDYGIDVSGFIDEMKDIGFYYANQSLSNYGETFSSLTSSLNMQYIDSLIEELETSAGSSIYYQSLRNNRVKEILEVNGYETIAFSTGYRWSEFTNSDIFYYTDFSNPLHGMSPFESLLFKTTIIYPFRGFLKPNSKLDSLMPHITAQRRIMEILPQIPKKPKPTFTFAHFLVPHVPFVFDVDGSILKDPGFYSGDNNGAINQEYQLMGYKKQVLFISEKILEICDEILRNSESPPIIVIQGDHGFMGENRYEILNLYYFPDENYQRLYETITPVNSFRIIFSDYFDMDYPLVEDKVFIE